MTIIHKGSVRETEAFLRQCNSCFQMFEGLLGEESVSSMSSWTW